MENNAYKKRNVSTSGIFETLSEISNIIYHLEQKIDSTIHTCNNIHSHATTLNSYNGQLYYENQNDNGDGTATVTRKFWKIKVNRNIDLLNVPRGVAIYLEDVKEALASIKKEINNNSFIAEQMSKEITELQESLGQNISSEILKSSFGILSTNIAWDEYNAKDEKFEKIKEENVQWWTDKPFRFRLDPNNTGTGTYIIEQQDDNGNWVGMGFTNASTIYTYLNDVKLRMDEENSSEVKNANAIAAMSSTLLSHAMQAIGNKGTTPNASTDLSHKAQLEGAAGGFGTTPTSTHGGSGANPNAQDLPMNDGSYTIQETNGTTKTYNAEGKLVSETSASGVVTTYKEDGSYEKLGLDGTTRTYDAEKKLVEIETKDGDTYSVQPNTSGGNDASSFNQNRNEKTSWYDADEGYNAMILEDGSTLKVYGNGNYIIESTDGQIYEGNETNMSWTGKDGSIIKISETDFENSNGGIVCSMSSSDGSKSDIYSGGHFTSTDSSGRQNSITADSVTVVQENENIPSVVVPNTDDSTVVDVGTGNISVDNNITIYNNGITRNEIPQHIHKELIDSIPSYGLGQMSKSEFNKLDPLTQSLLKEEIKILDPTNSEDLSTIISLKKDFSLAPEETISIHGQTYYNPNNKEINIEYNTETNSYTGWVTNKETKQVYNVKDIL